MSQHQTLKDAIEEFQPGSADVPILYSTVELNEKSFKALLGRKLISRPFSAATIAVWIFAFVILAASSAATTIMIGTCKRSDKREPLLIEEI